MEEVTNTELMSCPFCGTDAEIFHGRTDELFSKDEWVVRCSSVGVCCGYLRRTEDWGFTYVDDAIKAWNTRVESPALTLERECNAVLREGLVYLRSMTNGFSEELSLRMFNEIENIIHAEAKLREEAK